MKKVIVVVEYKIKEIVEETFGGTYETENTKTRGLATMKSLFNFFEELGMKYDKNKNVFQNLEGLVINRKIEGFSFKTNMKTISGFQNLPEYVDIFIE